MSKSKKLYLCISEKKWQFSLKFQFPTSVKKLKKFKSKKYKLYPLDKKLSNLLKLKNLSLL